MFRNSTSCAFQSALPARGATASRCSETQRPAHFNPRSPHGERQYSRSSRWFQRTISIHAPRTGSDDRAVGGRVSTIGFQSTLPARGATVLQLLSRCCNQYFNPRSPHGERPSLCVSCRSSSPFQSTLPARGATSSTSSGKSFRIFQSTLPARGATPTHDFQSCALHISIHAPRTGSDDTPPPSAPPASYFNPRSPHGERRFRPEPVAPTQDISIHAPRTGSDLPENAERITRRISIHAPRTGSDNPRRNHARQQIYFNPRSPHGERPPLVAVK